MIAITPPSERPRERCLESGAQSLSLRECLALILGSGPPKTGCLGLAQLLVGRAGTSFCDEDADRAFFTALEVSGKAYLSRVPGLGPAGQAKILAAFELGRRYSLFRSRHDLCRALPATARTSVANLTRQALQRVTPRDRAEPQEWLGFVPVYLSGHRTQQLAKEGTKEVRSQVGNLCIVEKGARTHVNVDPAELFAHILALRPRSIFLFHNHPSGSLVSSREDIHLTQQVRQLAQQFNITLLGHWIVTLECEREVTYLEDM